MQKAKLHGAKLDNALLDDADLQAAHCHGASFRSATLTDCKLGGALLITVDLSEANLRRADLAGAALRQSKCSHAHFEEAQLRQVDMTEAHGAEPFWSKAKMSGAKLHKARFANAHFDHAEMPHAELDNADVAGADFRGAVLRQARLVNADMTACDLRGACLEHAHVSGSKLVRADLRLADLRGAVLHANLTEADLRDAKVSATTNMDGSTVTGAQIHRIALLTMKNHGNLTQGDRLSLRIEDDAVSLRSSFSGIVGWVHTIALLLFVSPYAFFVGVRWWLSEVTEGGPNNPTIGLALVRFVLSGGQHWRTGEYELAPLMIVAFLVGVTYNVVRGMLLWKTKRLELTQLASDLPAKFSFADPVISTVSWRFVYRAAKAGFWINAAFLLFHTAHMLMTRVAI